MIYCGSLREVITHPLKIAENGPDKQWTIILDRERCGIRTANAEDPSYSR